MITTPIQRIYKPDVSRLISALKKIDPKKEEAKTELINICECVISNEVAVASPYICENKDFVVTNNEELYNALCQAQEGQVIFVPGETVIDMSDYIFTFEDGKQLLPVLKKGVILAGERGIGGSRGGMIRVQCAVDPLLAVEEGARITGLAFGGNDTVIEEKALVEHQCFAIRVDGDGVTIDNCEIAGFARCAILANGVKGLHVADCYIHDVFGRNAGYAVEGDGCEVILENNSFTRFNGIVLGKDTKVSESGSSFPIYPKSTNPADIPLPAVCTDLTNNDEGYILLKKMLSDDCVNADMLTEAIGLIGNYTNFEKLSYTADVAGEHFGPRSEFEPIGGGKGYPKIYTDGDYVVHNGVEFLAALRACQDGDVIFIPGDCVIDIPDSEPLPGKWVRLIIDKSITIASNRGQILPDGSVAPGGAILWPNLRPPHYCYVTAPDFRLSGLIFKGPDNHHHKAHHTRSFYMIDEAGKQIPRPEGHKYYYKLRMGAGFWFKEDGCEVENCEVCGGSYAALSFTVDRPKDQPVTKARSVGHKVHHCYIHHTQLQGLGYGVRLDWASVEIYANLFNFNRHSIAAAGYPEDAYRAHDNVEMGDALCHFFDMHSGLDRGDGTDIAGEYCEINYNTFLGNENPYLIRGRTLTTQHFDNNICYRARSDYKRAMTHNRYGNAERLDNVFIGKNVWNYADDPIVMSGGNPDEE